MRSHQGWFGIAALIIVSALFSQGARIASIGGKNDTHPFFSANDRSRWATIASLVEEHTYEIDTLIEIRDENNARPWNSIDKVKHLGKDGKQHFYSSKPPLLATLYAGLYQAIYSSTGLLLTEEPFVVGRTIVALGNLIPLAIFWFGAAFWIRDALKGKWARTLALLFVVWGTFLTSFANTLSNHLPGAIAIGVSLMAWRALEAKRGPATGWLLVAGMAAAFGVSCDLPSLSWLVAILGLFLVRMGWWSVIPYSIGVLPIAVAFCLTNFWAHGEIVPAYAHRNVGPIITSVARDEGASQPNLKQLIEALSDAGKPVEGLSILEPAARLDNLELCDPTKTLRYAVVEEDRKWTICEWGDWYDYPGSYWVKNQPKGVDKGEPSQWTYAFHVLLGHHGILSLTPFWCIGLWGSLLLLRSQDAGLRWLNLAILSVTVVCLGFYILRPEIDRNYGGVSCGFRWAFWMIPLWMVPTLEGIRSFRRSAWLRRIAEASLCVSIFSSCYPWSNPWVHPWLFQLLSYYGWIEY